MYKPGISNRVADAVFRKREEDTEDEKELRVVARPYWEDFGEILEEVKADEALKKVIGDLRNQLASIIHLGT